MSLTLRLICGYILRSLLPFLTCIYETLLDLEIYKMTVSSGSLASCSRSRSLASGEKHTHTSPANVLFRRRWVMCNQSRCDVWLCNRSSLAKTVWKLVSLVKLRKKMDNFVAGNLSEDSGVLVSTIRTQGPRNFQTRFVHLGEVYPEASILIHR